MSRRRGGVREEPLPGSAIMELEELTSFHDARITSLQRRILATPPANPSQFKLAQDQIDRLILNLEHAFEPYLSPNTRPAEITAHEVHQRYLPLKDQCDGLALSLGTYDHAQATPPVVPPVYLRPVTTLPQLTIPRFSGKEQDWNAFKATFRSLVEDDTTLNLTKLQKYQYLISALDSQPKQLIAHLDPTEENYDVCWRLLSQRYENPRRVVAHHTANLLGLPSVNSKSIHSLNSLLDTLTANFQGLQTVAGSSASEAFLVSYVLTKLDAELLRKWEGKLSAAKPSQPCSTVKELVQFLTDQRVQCENTALTLNTASQLAGSGSKRSSHPKGNVLIATTPTTTPQASRLNNRSTCPFCQQTHRLFRCPQFISKSVEERKQWVQRNHRCFNCFGTHHAAICPSSFKCRQCSAVHHTLLHESGPGGVHQPSTSLPPVVAPATPPEGSMTIAPEDEPFRSHSVLPASVLATSVRKKDQPVLLATTLVRLHLPNSHKAIIVRGIVDTAAAASFITRECLAALPCKLKETLAVVAGLGQTEKVCRQQCCLNVTTLHNQVLQKRHPFFVVDQITFDTPAMPISEVIKQQIGDYPLADPQFDTPSPVQCLLGVEIASLVLATATLAWTPAPGMPRVFHTSLGCILMGPAPAAETHSTAPANSSLPAAVIALASTQPEDLSEILQRFWEVEQPPPFISPRSKADADCEQFFQETTTRDQTGRYQVRLPFISSPEGQLGDSFRGAYAHLLALERRFSKDKQYESLYRGFMNDYLEQQHMRPAGSIQNVKYFIPHHGVFKSRGDTAKIRVVFNASAPTASGRSLNDLLHAGPKIHPLLADIIALFRSYRHVFTCDMKQMFRQINIHPEDQAFQGILWRNHVYEPPQAYLLTTVTYGTRPAPYLAMRVVAQLAKDEEDSFPLAAKVLRQQTFVDDLAVGAQTLETALQLRNDIIALLRKGGFHLAKWMANDTQLLSTLPKTDVLPSQATSELLTSVLGTLWNPKSDTLAVSVNFAPPTLPVTKRKAFSTIAKIFDPCGWLTPFTLAAKSFIQQLWLAKLDWDVPLTPKLLAEWDSLFGEISLLQLVQVPRTLPYFPELQLVLHGFCDASTKGYAAVLYLAPLLNPTNATKVKENARSALLAAKSRVAPLRTLTIPKLELCGAVLLAGLANHYSEILREHLPLTRTVLWTDSQIVLDWLRMEPHRHKTFVANRIAQILELTNLEDWNHVPTHDNPADIASRGSSASKLQQSDLWWFGPQWLNNPGHWPMAHNPVFGERELEIASPSCPILPTLALVPSRNMFARISSWHLLVGVVKVMLSWRHPSPSQSACLHAICRCIQGEAFGAELQALKTGNLTPLRIRRLHPFLDPHGVIRVGGRLQNSAATFNANPILLPKQHPLVALLIDHYHQASLHAGPVTTQCLLMRHFWILSARQAIRIRIHKCLACFRAKPTAKPPLMGDLPSSRVNISPPFTHTGFDYAGPFLVKSTSHKRALRMKAYICIFICFATKAVHLEVASDLSTTAFLDVLQRFISRRGSPSHLYSDCGTNFVGAAAILNRRVQRFLEKPSNAQAIQHFCYNKCINFHFNTPNSPHQGGLWERAIQAAKRHLARCLGKTVPTLMGFNSLLTRIEGILNSRPITPLSTDPTDLEALTPAHFLLGRPLAFPAELGPIPPLPYTSRELQALQSVLHSFWQRWRAEYLPLLHSRSKWTTGSPNLQVGDLVVVKELNTPPTIWPLGRIVSVAPGRDGVVRRVTLRTASGQYDRSASQLYRLPMNN